MLVITTPTGHVGRPLVDQLLGEDRPVRVIVRDPARLPAAVRDRAEVVIGSHADPTVLDTALRGAEALFWLVPPDPGRGALDHYRAFTEPACAAIGRHGVPRVVAVSSLGRAWSGPAGLLDGAFAMDGWLEATGVAYRSLAMPFFMDNLLTQLPRIRKDGVLAMANRRDRPLAMVATADVAHAAARLLADDGWSGQETVPVVSPDDLSPEGIAATLADALDRPVRLEAVTYDAQADVLRSYGCDERWVRDYVEMVAAQDAGIYDADVRGATRASTTLARWAGTALR